MPLSLLAEISRDIARFCFVHAGELKQLESDITWTSITYLWFSTSPLIAPLPYGLMEDFDGGDCCECTCIDGERFSCSDNINFSCRDPSALCFDGNDQDDDVDDSLNAENSGFRFSPWMLLLLLVILMCGMRASYSYPYWIGHSERSSDRTRWDEYMERNAGNTSVPQRQSQATGGQQTGLQTSNVSPLPPAQ